MKENHVNGHTATASGSIAACAECARAHCQNGRWRSPTRPHRSSENADHRRAPALPRPAMQPRSLSDAVGFLGISPKQEAVIRGCIEKPELVGCAQ